MTAMSYETNAAIIIAHSSPTSSQTWDSREPHHLRRNLNLLRRTTTFGETEQQVSGSVFHVVSWQENAPSADMTTSLPRNNEPYTLSPENTEKPSAMNYRSSALARTQARFRKLRHLEENHDLEGAKKPNSESIDAAIAFLDKIYKSPQYFATINDEGFAVIEFEDRSEGFFADITFLPKNAVECYARKKGIESEILEGTLGERSVEEFLSKLKIEIV